MSAAASVQPVVDAASVASRTRRQTRQRARSDDQDERQPTQSSAHVSPAMRLYRHALESIFAMLNLQDLSRALSVIRLWSAAVKSMKAIGATIDRDEDQLRRQGKPFRPLPPISSLVTGPLLRHVAGIHVNANGKDRFNFTPLTSESLALLLQHAPRLTSLWCRLTLAPAVLPTLPITLTSLKLTLGDEYSEAAINGVLLKLAALPSLSCLTLMATVDGVDLSLLAASRTLADFTLLGNHGCFHSLSDAHMKQIRSSLGHLQRIHVVCLSPTTLAQLLQPPVTARWQDIGSIFADAHTGDLLVTLPTLTKLELYYGGDAPHVDCLTGLPLLSTLKLHCFNPIPSAPVLAALLPCLGLTELDLRCEFTSAQVSTLLAALTKLRTLKLWCMQESLQCFASGPATRTLEELHLRKPGPAVPLSELEHLHAIKALRSLVLRGVFESLDDAALASLTPPTARLPRLTRFAHTREEDWSQIRAERTGPSFESMQQQMIQ